jgi:hypothetical protein
MDLVPVKLLKNQGVKKKILKMMKDNPSIDKTDYLESRIETNTVAKKLMAIENASELAKRFLFKGDTFDAIGEAIKLESQQNFDFSCKLNHRRTNGVEYIHLEKHYPDTGEGHFALAKVNHNNKIIELYDSMGSKNPEFKKDLQERFPEYKRFYKGLPLQPSGGIVYNTPTEFNQKAKIRFKTNEMLMKSFEISQYDELSQHHFCYIEAFVMLMHKTLGTPIGPKDPRNRLPFLKKVIWGLVHKFTPMSERKGPEWEYFVTNFKYYMVVTDEKNKRLKLQNIAQVAPNGIRRKVLSIRLPSNITSKTSLKEIVTVQ